MNNDYPNTFRAIKDTDRRPHIFDPSLKQFARAFRLGDSASSTAHERLEWEIIRSEVRAHLLQLVAQSRWKDKLVLRGSVLMQQWFGAHAREPKDIDWVFRSYPPLPTIPSSSSPTDQPISAALTFQSSDVQVKACMAELVELVRNNPRTSRTQILVSEIASDDIWTYERAQGKRLIFPFRDSEGGSREVQMDITWNEPLYESPVLAHLDVSGRDIQLWTATPELSLMWKLLWLLTDGYPQGKDLYDAVLLAESTTPSADLISAVLETADLPDNYEVTADTFKTLYVDWENFQREYPWIEGNEQQWKTRLQTALQSFWR